MKILIADDSRANLKMFEAYCTEQGHTVVTAENGLQAVEKFSSESPDLILMDVIMPVMDGYEATSRIKALSGDLWIPVILVTAQICSDENLIQGISAGADDYLTKPVNLILLREKIKVMQRITGMQSALHTRLNKFNEGAREEIVLARHVMERLERKVGIDESLMQRWILPAQDFSADVIAACLTTGNKLHVILADGTGHGLAAVLCVMPVTETFYAMTGRGFPISSIVQELNQKIKRLTPVERFVAATLVSIDWPNRTVEVWNGGGPSARLMSENGRLLHTWKSRHLPLGVLSNEEIDTKTEIYQWDEPGQFFLFSDGLLDVRNKFGSMFGEERVLKILSETAPAERFDQLKRSVNDHLAGETGDDDISLVSIQCPLYFDMPILGKIRPERRKAFSPEHWKVSVSFDAEVVKKETILPILLTWLNQVGISEKHSQRLFLILSELYNNAVDHGLLKLDSRLKTLSKGFEVYLKQRSKRLSMLDEGTIEIHIERTQESSGDFLYLEIKDSGDGFDFLPYLNKEPGDIAGSSGRGIALVKSLTKEMSYKNEGNEVHVVYELIRAAVAA